MSIIKASAAIRQNYPEISRLCKETGEPIYLTKNGEGDLVVMSIDAFEEKIGRLELRASILEHELEYANGTEKTMSAEECMKLLRARIKEYENGTKK